MPNVELALRGISPVSIAVPKPDVRFRDGVMSEHNFNKFKPQSQPFAVNNLACWDAYTNSIRFYMSLEAKTVIHFVRYTWPKTRYGSVK